MDSEHIADLRNKLQPIKTLIEHIKQGKEVPREFVELASKHMVEIEEFLESL